MLEFSRSNNGIPLAFYNDHLMRISISGEAAKKFYDYLKQAIPQFKDKIHVHKPIHMLLLICENGEQSIKIFFLNSPLYEIHHIVLIYLILEVQKHLILQNAN